MVETRYLAKSLTQDNPSDNKELARLKMPIMPGLRRPGLQSIPVFQMRKLRLSETKSLLKTQQATVGGFNLEYIWLHSSIINFRLHF